MSPCKSPAVGRGRAGARPASHNSGWRSRAGGVLPASRPIARRVGVATPPRMVKHGRRLPTRWMDHPLAAVAAGGVGTCSVIPGTSIQRAGAGAVGGSLGARPIPGAAASIRKGLERKGADREAARSDGNARNELCARPTSSENLMGSVAAYTRRVKRWCGGPDDSRWVASAGATATCDTRSGRWTR